MIVERFSISVEKELLADFDAYLKKKGYDNRSEAVRDLIREAINNDAIEEENVDVVALLALLFDHQKRDLSNIIDDCSEDLKNNILSTMIVPIGEFHCFQSLVLKGKSQEIKTKADKIIGKKGVNHGRLFIHPSKSFESEYIEKINE